MTVLESDVDWETLFDEDGVLNCEYGHCEQEAWWAMVFPCCGPITNLCNDHRLTVLEDIKRASQANRATQGLLYWKCSKCLLKIDLEKIRFVEI